MLPSLVALQPFFPKLIQWIILYGRVIIAPLLIIYAIRQHFSLFFLLLFLVYVGVTTVLSSPYDWNDSFIVYFSLFASIVFHKFGQYLSNRPVPQKPLLALAYGTAALNIITILVYYLLGFGYIDMEWFLVTAGKGFMEPLFRFSLGNAIELPLAVTCLLYIAILLLRRRQNLLFTTSFNLMAAILSQSRLIVFIALLLFLG
ncbi:MAG TPA: hypothetical protein VF145_07635, partial [Chitinophagaceae bacterium]